MKTAVSANSPDCDVVALAAARGSMLRSCWALYELALRQYAHGKRWVLMAVLLLLAIGLAIFVRLTAPNVPSMALEFSFAFMLIPHAILPLLALVYASGVLQDEQEEQTITYLLIRPIPKWAIYIVKLLAAVTTTVFLTVVFTVCVYAAFYLGANSGVADVPLRCLKAVSVHSLAVVCYCCLFGLMSLLTKRILIVGVIYVAIFEGLFANLAFGIRLVTVIYYARLIAYRILPFVVQEPGRSRTVDLAANAWQLDVRKDPHLLEHPQLSTCVMILLVASLVCTILGAILCARREFHVKSPGKD